MVAQFDGINNVGNGDKGYDQSATTWVDLKKGITLTQGGGTPSAGYGWQNGGGFKFSDTTYFSKNFGNLSTELATLGIPVNNQTRAIEVVWKNPAAEYSSWTSAQKSAILFNYGNAYEYTNETTSKELGQHNGIFGVRYYSVTQGCDNTDTNHRCEFQFINNSNSSFATISDTLLASSTFGTASAINSSSSNYSTSIANSVGYLNGVSYPSNSSFAGAANNTAPLVTQQKYMAIGARRIDNQASSQSSPATGTTSGIAKDFTIYSVRLYNKTLSQIEANKNAAVDQVRFKNPPKIYINDSYECTNLLVISSTQIQCTAPAQPEGAASVKLEYNGATATLAAGSTGGLNYVPTTISSVSPAIGPAGGGNEIIINGTNFAYAGTDDFIQDGLVAQYDGINNVGLGDSQHSNSTTKWVNLRGAGTLTEVLKSSPGAHGWQSNGYLIDEKAYFTDHTGVPATFPIGNANRAIEIVYETPATGINVANSAQQNAIFFSYGQTGSNQSRFSVRYFADTSRKEIQLINSGSCDVTTSINDSPINFYQQSKIFSTSSNWNGTKGTSTGYLDGIFMPKTKASGTGDDSCYLQTGTEAISLGGRFTSNTDPTGIENPATGYKIMSVRLYNRPLSEVEAAHNSALDQIRYTQLPVVHVGGTGASGETQYLCTNVVMISSTKIKCTAPAGVASTNVNVYVSIGGGANKVITNGYRYISASESYVSAVSPAIGPLFGGTVLTLNGANLGTTSVTSVRVGGTVCPIVAASQTEGVADDSIQCTVAPGQTAGYSDIQIYKDTAVIQTFSAGFEYIDVTPNPVAFRVSSVDPAATDPSLDATSALIAGDSAAVFKLTNVSVEPNWNGISKVIIKYPSTAGLPSSSYNPYGFQQEGELGNVGGIKTITLGPINEIPQSSAAVQQLLNGLYFKRVTVGVEPVGSVEVQLVNALWGN